MKHLRKFNESTDTFDKMCLTVKDILLEISDIDNNLGVHEEEFDEDNADYYSFIISNQYFNEEMYINYEMVDVLERLREYCKLNGYEVYISFICECDCDSYDHDDSDYEYSSKENAIEYIKDNSWGDEEDKAYISYIEITINKE